MPWHARLQLKYTVENVRTVARFEHNGPLRILQSLYPEGDGICHNVLVHPPGGLVGGDPLDITATVGPGAHGLVTTPGATRFYRSAAERALQRTHLLLEEDSRLEWLPLEALCYNACNAENHLTLNIAPGAECIGWDVTALGLPHAGQPFATGRFVQHMQKALTQMNIQLANVISDVVGETGQKILRAIVAGERDPDTLAAMRDVRCRESVQTIRAAMVGNFQPEHVFALAQALALFDSYQERIADCDAQIERTLQLLNADKVEPEAALPKPRSRTKQTNSLNFDVRPLLYQLTGMDLTQIHGIGPSVALALIAECGTDLSRWPTEKHFTSWLTLSPGCKISGGKVLSSHTRKSNNRIAARLRLVATAVGRTETALGAFYRRLAARVGKAKALTATARKIAILFYKATRFGMRYEDPGADQYEQRYRERVVKQLQRRAAHLGFALQPVDAGVS